MSKYILALIAYTFVLTNDASAQQHDTCVSVGLQSLSAPCADSGCDFCFETFEGNCNSFATTELNRSLHCETPFTDVRAFVRTRSELSGLRAYARVTVPSGGFAVGGGIGAAASARASLFMQQIIEIADPPAGGVFVFPAIHISGALMSDHSGSEASASAGWSIWVRVNGTVEDSLFSQFGGEFGTWVPSYPAPVNQIFEVELELGAGATARAGLDSSANATAALERTVAWLGIDRIEDFNGNVLTGYTVTDPDGFDWTQSLHCPADLAPEYGVLDFDDVLEFVTLFSAMHPGADLAPPTGVFDFDDVLAFLVSFGDGCP